MVRHVCYSQSAKIDCRELRKTLSKAMQNKITRNITLILGGILGAQLISLAFTPIVTRLYSPETFGLFGIIMAAVAVISPLATAAYPTAITLPKKDSDARGLALLAFFIAIATALIILVFLLFESHWLGNILKIRTQETTLLLLIPLIVFCMACLDISGQWMIRNKAFATLAHVSVTNSLVMNITKVGAGLLHPAATTLLLIAAFANTLQTLTLQWHARKHKKSIFNSSIQYSFLSLKTLAKRYIDFPLYRMPQLTILSLSQNLPILILASFAGPASAGFYTLARTTMAAPVILIGKSVGDVLYPHINDKIQAKNEVTHTIRKSTLVLATLGFLPFATLVYFGPQIFSVLFGSEWATAGEYGRWLGLLFYFNLLSKPSLAAAPALGMQKHILVYEIASTLTKALGLLLGLYFFSSEIIAVMLYSIIASIFYLIIIKWVLSNSRIVRYNTL